MNVTANFSKLHLNHCLQLTVVYYGQVRLMPAVDLPTRLRLSFGGRFPLAIFVPCSLIKVIIHVKYA